MDADEVRDLVDQVAAEPAEAESDGQRAKQHKLSDLIALEKHRAATEAATNNGTFGGIRFGRVIPPGAGPR